jgi:hypothetical protein
MDSSVSPTHGEQEKSVWNGHYACTCYHPLFVFEALRPGNVHSADGWDDVLKPVVARYQGNVSRIYFRADAGFASLLGRRADQVCDPASGQPGSTGQDRLPAQTPGRPPPERSASVPCQFHLSGGKLDQAAPSDRQSAPQQNEEVFLRRIEPNCFVG